MKEKKYLFIGCGNMGEPVLHAFLQSGVHKKNVIVIERNEERQLYLKKKYKVEVKDTVLGIQSDVLVLAIKPQQLADIAFQDINFSDHAIVLSILAGTPIKKISELTGIAKIVRCMPNLPLMLGEGMSSLVFEHISSEEKVFFKKVFSQAGKVIELKSENDMHMTTLLAGSGPGLYYYFCDIFEKLARNYGFSQEDSSLIARQTFIGAAEYAKMSDISAKELVTMVASKGGTTEAALKAFESMHLTEIFEKAIQQGVDRSKELSGESKN